MFVGICTKCVFKTCFHLLTKTFFVYKLGLNIYPKENSLIRWFVYSIQIFIFDICNNGIRKLAPNTDSILKRWIWFHLSFVSIVLLMKSSDEIFFSYMTIFDNIKSINFIVNLFNNNLFLRFSCDWDFILSICNGGLSIYSSSSAFSVSFSRFILKLSSFFFKHQYLLYVNLVSCRVYHLYSIAY